MEEDWKAIWHSSRKEKGMPRKKKQPLHIRSCGRQLYMFEAIVLDIPVRPTLSYDHVSAGTKGKIVELLDEEFVLVRFSRNRYAGYHLRELEFVK